MTADPTTGPVAEFRSGLREIMPLAAGVVIYGLAFGVLASQALMGGLETGAMGSLVFAGAAQIVAVERAVAGAGALAALVAGIALNLRLVLVTASIRAFFTDRPWWQVALGAHFSTDENWAMTVAARKAGRDVGYWHLIGGGAGLFAAWLCSTVAGVMFASAIPEPRALGIDFAFTAAFILIARTLWQGRQDLLPWGTSIAVVALALWSGALDPSWALILGGVAGAVIAGIAGDD